MIINNNNNKQSIMKKYFVFAAAALVALAACSKVETDETPAKKISFNATTYVAQTKADPTTHHSLYTTEGVSAFQSKAFLFADSDGDGDLDAQNMFGTAGETVTYSTTNHEWVPANEYFWPKAANSYINFVSWYSKNAKSQLVPAEITTAAMNWGTNSAPVTIVSDDNILFADVAWRFKDNVREDPTYGYDSVTEGVPTLFHHALAKLSFDMKLKTTTASTKTIWDVEIQEADLIIANNGYLPLVNAAPSGTASATSAWKVGSDAATSGIVGWTAGSSTETISEGSSATASTTAFGKLLFENFAPKTLTDRKYESTSQVFLAERTVMPQTLGSTVKFMLKFKIKLFHDTNNDGTKDGAAYSEEVITITEQNLTALVSAPTSWNMNTKVKYTITIDPVGKIVKFDPAVVDWAENTAAETQVYPAS